jgi:hypothetical protein
MKSVRFTELVPLEVNIAKWSADLSEESDIRVFVDVFFKFILQVQKQDGS